MSFEKHNTYIVDCKVVGETYMLLKLEKPQGYEFLAGQYTKLFLPNNPEKPIYLSIASAPEHKTIDLCIAVKDSEIRKYYQELHTQKSEVQIDKAEGKFILPNEIEGEFVFVAGGSGVSPLRSMSYSVLNTAKSVKFLLGAARDESIPYLEEFSKMDEDNETFSFLPCVEKGSHYQGNVVQYFENENNEFSKKENYFLCGPNPMIDAFEQAAFKSGVGRDQLFYEKY